MKKVSTKIKTKSIVLLLGEFESEFYKRLSDQRSAASVFVLEGRPSLETSRQVCRQLLKRRITPTVIADNMAGFLFFQNLVKEVWVSCQLADRHGALCDIGSLILAVLARKHKVPLNVYPAAKKVRFIAKPKEICSFDGSRTAPRQTKAYVPLLEWVPSTYVRKIYGKC